MADPLDEDALSLVNSLDLILERVVTEFENRGIDLPDVRYWTTGGVAYDCEELVIVWNQIYSGTPDQQDFQAARCQSPRTAAIDIHLVRCIPTPKGPRATPPTPEQIQAAARQQAIDAWALNDIATCCLDHFDPTGMGGLGVLVTTDAVPPEGGMAGVITHVTFAVP